MNRRDFLAVTATVTLALPLAARAEPVPYAPGLVEADLAAGKTVFLDFSATWCTTCAAQDRAMQSWKSADPAYEANIAFIKVDWDTYKDAEITRRLNIPRRSTLVVLKGDRELGRIVAGTSKTEIKALMDTALAAATGSA